jgi:tetratricopeptide (TPR) repeat protein
LQGSPARTFDAEGTLREGQLTLDDVATSTPPDGHRQVRGDRWLSGESENLSSIRETTGADHPMRSRSDQSGKFSRRDEPTSVDWQQPEQLAYVVLQIDVQATQLDNPPSKQYRQQLLKNLGETIVGIMHNAKLAVIDIREDSFVARQDRSSDSIVRLIRDSESLIEQIANHCEPSVPARIRGRCVIVAVSAKVVDAIEEAKVSAQRLFQTMPVDCVWFDHEIYQMLDQPIECEEIALASLDRQVVYELIKRDIATSGDMLCRAFDVEQLPWVGREAEMAALHGHWAYVVQTGEFRTLLVLGDMGVGRSRLIEMWRRQVGHNAHVFIGAASWFSSASSGSPYLLSLLNSHLYSLELEPPQGILGRVSSLASMQGETALQYRDLWSQALTELYNSTRPASQVAEDTVEWIIRSSVSEAPVLVIFDDLFLLDRSSQNLLENLMRQPPARTMLVIVSSHQEYEELLFSSLSQAERMEISPLSARESYKIIEALLPRTDDHREHLSRIVEQAEGNAQALLMLAQQYVDPASHSDYNRPSLADRLPMDAQQAILRQLSGLSSLERDTLRKAAAIGDRFWKSCVECLERLDISEGNWGLQDGVLISYVDDRNECLKSLSERGLIEPVEHSAVANELEFRFRNRLLRSVCLQQIPYTIRQQMHRHVAFWLMQHDENQLLIADLVNHLQLADNKDAAARCLLDAAELAFNRDRCRDALSLLSGHFDDPELQNPLLQMKALYLSGIAYQRMGDFAAAIRLHNSALQISWQLADHKSGSRYFLELGQSRAYLGDFASAYSDILNAQTLAQQVRDPDLLWRCRLQLAMLALLKGEAIQAREQLQEARRFLPETPTEHPLRWASLLYAMGWLYKLEGRWHESAQSLQESSNLRKNNNAQLPYAESLLQHGEFLFSMGDEQGAIPLLEQAVELSRSREAYQLLTRALMHLAHAYLRRRNTQQAYTLLLEAWQHCKVSNNNSNMTQISAAIAAVATLGRQSQEAMRFAQIAAQRVQSGLPIHRGWAYYFLGEAASGMSPERANQIFEPLPSPLPEGGIISYCFLKAVEMFKYCGEVANQLSALLALARALFTMGSTRTSAQILDRSIADAKQLGLSLLLERMENQRRLISGVEPALPVASISPNQSTLLIRRASSSDPSSNSPSSMPPSPQQTTPRISSAVPRPSFPPPLTSYEQPHKKK